MPSRLKRAILAVKDQTSISLAKVGGSDVSNLEVAILKATTHEEIPVDEKYVTEVLKYVSSNRSYAGSCARAIGRRNRRTKNWIVATKSLVLVLRIFQDGDPYFPKEVLHAMKRGYKILNLSSFRDESTSTCPWDFTAFVRTFALYLDERLDCFLTGKLQRRRTSHHDLGKTRGYSRKIVPIVRDMKPSVLLDRISHWQRLLDRAIATRPTGAAKTNRLVQICLYNIVQETFELYNDISDGLALLLDSFFHLQYTNCVSAFQTCVKASKQFEELCSYYDLCKTIGVGRTSEYPSVQKISDELIDTLQEFLKDSSSFPGKTPGISTSLPPLSPYNSEFGPVRPSNFVDWNRDRSLSEYGGSHCTSLEDLIWTDPGFSPDRYSDPGRGLSDNGPVRSSRAEVLDLLSLDGPLQSPVLPNPRHPELGSEQGASGFEEDSKDGWELVLFETSDQPSNQCYSSEIDLFGGINGNGTNPTETNYINPFLADTIADLSGFNGPHPSQGSFDADFGEGGFSSQPTFRADFGNITTKKTVQFADDFLNDLGFCNATTNETGHLSGGLPSNLGRGIERSTTLPIFHVEFNNTSIINGSDTYSAGFQTNSSLSRSISQPTMFDANFGNDLDLGIARSATTMAPTFDSKYSNTGMNGFDHYSAGFPADSGVVSINPATPSFVANKPTDLFAEFDHHPTFRSESFDASNEMNAIVVFSQPNSNNDDFFSTGLKFQATPTFKANSIDMDHQDQQNGYSFENDPFGPLVVMPAWEQQQKLWLQNQNRIMARHLT